MSGKDQNKEYRNFSKNLILWQKDFGRHNLPWQIAMIKVKGDEVISEKDYHIKWDTHLSISADAARITKFNPKLYEKKALPVEEVFPTIKDWLENCDYIIGHNFLGFDLYLIKDLYAHMGESYKPLVNKIIDTNCLARGLKTDNRYTQDQNLLEYQYKMYHTRVKGIKTNLSYLGKEYEIDHDYESLHDALVDLKLNIKVWNKLSEYRFIHIFEYESKVSFENCQK